MSLTQGHRARADGLRVVISLNDHLPAHLRVLGDGEVKINLLGADDAPELVWADNASRSQVRRALRLVRTPGGVVAAMGDHPWPT